MAVKWGHILTVLVLGLGFSTYDVVTDGMNGNDFLQEKEVNRTFGSNATIPSNCLAVEDIPGLL